ncbi:4-hydroxy-tetrahydrodipicolinate reductase [Idiomarina seosinensis]|uniref:4-hydroxy-tetrahydrodipicolinate reductase n=1 Tax=Idiomarina seosinensis TaxID=281739 RepID=A0A432ZH27_9GAMM|nr:4-hydroxy-tetrahydrodipicolinate reductase [Idiomarina seosinensis]RUO77194.1 4-hydroxy-tetrahydrodipicolinate reductase [Idiomarina seosinensis]
MKVAVIGASGRMGQAVIAALQNSATMELTAAIVSEQSNSLGKSVAGVNYQTLAQLEQTPDVFIDFSLPQALTANLNYAIEKQTPMVVCTTGLDASQRQQLQQAAKQVPLLYARNTSVGIALLEQLVALSAAALSDADIEIFEAHHKYKKDGPSGTALALGEAAASGRQQSFDEVSAGVRSDGERQQGSIGFSVLRAADIVGEHQVMLAQEGERLELNHRVSDRKIFAEGALRAANWLVEQPKGLYHMKDILALQQSLHRLLNS